MKKYDYNLIVIGGGSAGLVSAYVAAAAKAKVALIEKHQMGGDCLNTGCVPSKALIRSASFMRDVARAPNLGFKKVSVDFNFSEVMQRVQRVIATIEPHDSVQRYQQLGVECYQHEAKIISPYEVDVDGKHLSTRAMIIAAGASPFVPPIKGLDTINYYTSDTIWTIRQQPKRLLVIGGGPIGSELAQAFAYLGCEVTQVEGGPRILSREDDDAADLVMQNFKHCGVRILSGAKAKEVCQNDGKDPYMIVADENGNEQQVPFDSLLLAVGRQANGDKVVGLKDIGVAVNNRGCVVVNHTLQTSIPNIYACGDIIGSYQFTHTASHAAITAVINSLSPLPFKKSIDWSVVPWCTFTHPEIARVGINEQEAKKAGVDYEVTKYGIDDLDRAIADEEAQGFVKLITSTQGKLLGVTIVGDHAGDLLHEYVLAMKKKISLRDILSTIHIYPTLAEANRFAASEWNKKKISPAFVAISEKINRFLRG